MTLAEKLFDLERERAEAMAFAASQGHADCASPGEALVRMARCITERNTRIVAVERERDFCNAAAKARFKRIAELETDAAELTDLQQFVCERFPYAADADSDCTETASPTECIDYAAGELKAAKERIAELERELHEARAWAVGPALVAEKAEARKAALLEAAGMLENAARAGSSLKNWERIFNQAAESVRAMAERAN